MTADAEALSLPVVLAAQGAALEEALQTAVGRDPGPMAAAARYVLGWEDAEGRPASNEGKRIRPALCLMAAQLVGGDPAAAMPGAVAVELVHNFSLVHDEVQDHDAERHHRPTLWARLGEAQAINVGNFLYTRAIQSVVAAPGDPSLRMRALQVLNTAIGEMLDGQWADIDFESRDDVTVDEYLAMVAGKTGALLAAPLEIGALLAGGDPEQAAILGRWGRQVGLAFQAQDDYLGIWGNPNLTGKSNTNDIARRKKTLPIIHGLGHPASREAVLAAYRGGELSMDAVADVTASLTAAESGPATRRMAAEFTTEATRLLDLLPFDARARDALASVAGSLLDREG